MLRFFNCKRIISYIFLSLANLPMPGRSRWWYLKMAGVKFDINNNCKPNIFIGKNVLFDTLRPDNITIMNNVHIASGTKILTHYYNPVSKSFTYGNVRICEGVFIGVNSVICNAVTIGEHSVLGAGSIVVKDIPPFEVWGGVPARFIKKLVD